MACVGVQTTVGVWVAAAVTAAPYPFFTRTYFYLSDPRDGSPLADSLICTVPAEWLSDARVLLQLSTFVLFVFPMTLIIVLYVLIGLAVQRRAVHAPADSGGLASHRRHSSANWSTAGATGRAGAARSAQQSRKNVIEMLGQSATYSNY